MGQKQLAQRRKCFRRLVLVTLVSCYTLIGVGAIVRASGSGLGCPDWPQCFGRWIPPLHVTELPPNYQTLFSIQGKRIDSFSAFKTWTEYLNRLLGVIVGFQVFLLMLTSLRLKRPDMARWSFFLFLLVGFQGWLGSQVVSSHLSSALVTLHLLMAIGVFFILLELFLRIQNLKGGLPNPGPGPKVPYGWPLAMALIQLVLGTQVREQIDPYLHGMAFLPRDQWYDNLQGIFYLHRPWAYGLLLCFLVHFYRHHKALLANPFLRKITILSTLTLGAHVLSGMAFKHLAFPVWNQPLHLLLACLLISWFFLGLRLPAITSPHFVEGNIAKKGVGRYVKTGIE